MIQVPGLAPNPDDEDDQILSPMQAPQLDAPTMSLGTRAPLQAVDGSGGGGGSAPPPAAPPIQPGIAIMQPPERSDKTEHRGEQVNQTFTQISPEAANDIGQMGAAHTAAQKARAEQAKTRDPVAEVNALGAEKQAIALQLAEARKQEAIAKAEPQIKAAMAADHQATQEMEGNRKFTDYWDDKGTPAKLFAALLVGLNQYAVTGRGMNGHNMAWEIFQNAAAADRQRKLDKFNASKEMSELRKRDVGAAQAALKDKLAQFDNEAVAMGKAYAAQTKAYAERIGKPAALAAAAETDAKADALEAETRLKQRKDYEKKFTVEGERDDSGHTVNTVKAPVGDALVYGPGAKGIFNAPSPTTAKEVNASNATFGNFDALLSGLQKSYEKHGKVPTLNPTSPIYAERENLRASATLALKDMAKLGQISAGDQKLINDAISGGYTGEQAIAKLKQARESALTNQTIFLDARGVPGKQVAGAWVAGAPQPQATPPASAGPRSHVETRQINGKTYVRVGGTWKVQD